MGSILPMKEGNSRRMWKKNSSAQYRVVTWFGSSKKKKSNLVQSKKDKNMEKTWAGWGAHNQQWFVPQSTMVCSVQGEKKEILFCFKQRKKKHVENLSRFRVEPTSNNKGNVAMWQEGIWSCFLKVISSPKVILGLAEW